MTSTYLITFFLQNKQIFSNNSQTFHVGIARSEPGGTRWRTGEEVKVETGEWSVGSQ